MTLAIYSAGGFTREILYFARTIESATDGLCIVDDAGTLVDGLEVISFEQLLETDTSDLVVAFGDPSLRKRKVSEAQARFNFPTLIAPTAFVGANVDLGVGSILCHNSTITADAKVGNHVHMNIYSYVAHDCVVEDFVTISPRVSINGRVHVKEGAYIGSDATVLPGKAGELLVIGQNAVVGAGALVTKSVPAGATVVGSPARSRS